MTRFLIGAVLLAALVGCGTSTAPATPPIDPTPANVPGNMFDDPAQVSIPAIAATDEVVSVGLNQDRTMEVPPVDVVGWYELGVDIGSPGPAVLAGHVNYEGVAGAFSRIGELKPGDEVTVTDTDGDAVTFQVYAVVSFPKAQFDHRLVYGNTVWPELRLVTCSGEIRGRSYSDNTVVLARHAP